MRIWLIGMALAALAWPVVPAAAQGDAALTWVSAVGDDANPCTRTAPCRTFARALNQTAFAGTISVLDAGSFGAVTIDRTLTIRAVGVQAAVLIGVNDAITVAAASDDRVILEGLDISGVQNAQNGLRIRTAAEVIVRNGGFRGFVNAGIWATASGGRITLSVLKSRFIGNQFGVLIDSPNGRTTANVVDSLFSANTDSSVRVSGFGNTAVLSGNRFLDPFRAVHLPANGRALSAGDNTFGSPVSDKPTVVPPGSPPPALVSPSYPTYAQLSGDQTFATSCAPLSQGTPQFGRPAVGFGYGLTVGYGAASQTYTISADSSVEDFGTPRTFGPAERDPPGSSGAVSYRKTVNGFLERFSIGGQPTVGGVAAQYVRQMSMTVRGVAAGSNGNTQPTIVFSCALGVPTLPADEPAARQIVFGRTMFSGAGYLSGSGIAGLQSYSLSGSEVSFSVNLADHTVTATIHFIGVLQTMSGPSGGPVDLGTYSGTVDIDDSGFYNGGLTSASPPMGFSNLGGWFYGPQGAEAAFSVAITSAEQSGRRFQVYGTALALR